MLSSLKKPSEAAPAGIAAWHPNFRDIERLPDTKVVRTSFFLNVLAVTLTLGLATYVGFREFQLAALRSETETILRSVDSTKRGSDNMIALYKKFQEEEKRIKALEQFLAAPRLVYSDFLLRLGQTLPNGISFRTVDCRASMVLLSGEIEGLPDEASGRANLYVESLAKNEIFKPLFKSIVLTNIAKDSSTNKMQFTIEMQYMAPAVRK